MEQINSWSFIALLVESPTPIGTQEVRQEILLRELSTHPIYTEGIFSDPKMKDTCAMINGELVLSKLQLGAAVMRLKHHLARIKRQAPAQSEENHKRTKGNMKGYLRTKRLTSEFVLMLSPTKNVGEAMRNFSFLEKVPLQGTQSKKTHDETSHIKASSILTRIPIVLAFYREPHDSLLKLIENKVNPFLESLQSPKERSEKGKRRRTASSQLEISMIPLDDLHKYCNPMAIKNVYDTYFEPKEKLEGSELVELEGCVVGKIAVSDI